MKTVGMVIAVLAVFITVTVLSVKYGSPQSVWFYCEILRWCKP